MPPGRQSWMFTKEQLESTPSLQDGMALQQERAVRNSTCKFIQKSFVEGRQNPKLLGVTCLFLACKTEEDGHPVRELIWSMNKIAGEVDATGRKFLKVLTRAYSKATYPYGAADDCSKPVDKQGKRSRQPWMVEEETGEFQKVKDNILQAERLILHVLDFDFQVRHPITHIKEVVCFLDEMRKRNADNTDFEEKRRLVQGDGTVLSDLGQQIYSVLYTMRGCVFTAIQAVTKNNPYQMIKVAKWTKQYAAYLSTKYKDDKDLLSVAQGLTKEHILDVKNQMLDFYDAAEADHEAQQAAAIPLQQPQQVAAAVTASQKSSI